MQNVKDVIHSAFVQVQCLQDEWVDCVVVGAFHYWVGGGGWLLWELIC